MELNKYSNGEQNIVKQRLETCSSLQVNMKFYHWSL
jgi:hypothetical protein